MTCCEVMSEIGCMEGLIGWNVEGLEEVIDGSERRRSRRNGADIFLTQKERP